MTPEEYRVELDRAKAEAVALSAAIVREVQAAGGRLSAAARDRVLELLFRAIEQGRERAMRVALRMHAEQSPQGYSPDIREPHYEPHAVESLMARTLDKAVADDDVSWPKVERDVTAAVGRHVEMAARDTVVASVHADEDAVGFARVLMGEESCAFCLMLASRGPVYGSRYLAGDPDIRRFHDGCDCLVVAVFNEDADWLGKDRYKDAKAIYDEYGKGKDDPLNAVRRHLDGKKREAEQADAPAA